MTFIYVTIILDVLGFGILIPVLAPLVLQLTGQDAAQGAVVYGLLLTIWSLMQFLFSPLVGAISDRFLQTLAAIGSADEAEATIRRYQEAGASSPCLGGVPGTDVDATLEALAHLAG